MNITSSNRKLHELSSQQSQTVETDVSIEVRLHVAKLEVRKGVQINWEEVWLQIVQATYDKLGNRRQLDPASLFVKSNEGTIRIPSGLAQRVREILQAEGFSVQVVDQADWTQFQRTNQSLDEADLQPSQYDFLQAIDGKPLGRIGLQVMANALLLIAALVRLYPEEHILIVTKNNYWAERLGGQLRECTGRGVLVNSELQFNDQPYVGTCSIANFRGANVTDWTIVVVLGAEAALAMTTLQQLGCMDQSLRFAFVPIAHSYDQQEQFILQTFYGPEVYRLDNRPPGHTDVTVVLTDPSSYPASKPQNPLQRKRDLVWHNGPRNKFVADIARAFRNKDVRGLERLGIESSGLQLNMENTQLDVAILVETPEHGGALQQHLPGWELLDAQETNTNRDLNLPLEADQAIITQQRARRAGVVADVVIRAEGTAQRWENELGPIAYFAGPTMLVVDITDDFDQRAVEDTRRRVEDYRRRDWRALGNADALPDSLTMPLSRVCRPGRSACCGVRDDGLGGGESM